MNPDLQPQAPFPPNAAPETSAQKQSTNCTNSTNSSISEIREISGPAPKISVIVPVYKVEKYLPECIESVLAQTFTDFELILVDDGSPDNSGAICDAYAARDPRIRVFHKENGGVTSARRLGVERSRGEWITFVDSDDKLFPNALRDLWNIAKQYSDVDLVEGQTQHFNPNTDKRTSEYKKISSLDYIIGITQGRFFRTPWGKLIRRSSFHDSVFPSEEIFWGEDTLMNLSLSFHYRHTVKCPVVVYFYRPSSAHEKYCHTEKMFMAVLRKIEALFKTHVRGPEIINAFTELYFFDAFQLNLRNTLFCSWNEFFDFFDAHPAPQKKHRISFAHIAHVLNRTSIPRSVWLTPLQFLWKTKGFLKFHMRKSFFFRNDN